VNPVEVVGVRKSDVRVGRVGKVAPRERRQIMTRRWTADHQRAHVFRHVNVADLDTHTHTHTYTHTCMHTMNTQKCARPSSTRLPGPTRPSAPNNISIKSAVFPQHTLITNRQTDIQTDRQNGQRNSACPVGCLTLL